ncbi:MAG: hypothetical protein H6734_06405 [Alphaproteobacteria bacterium]|nr:hypothetical protein [Alphaproteobacteria bacterium]
MHAAAPDASSTLDFRAPGPGAWTFDATHQSLPMPRILWRPIERGANTGFAGGFEDAGALLATIETRVVHGWVYQAPRPIGAPPDATSRPPWLLFKLATWLHPEIRRRLRTSAAVFEERPWRAAATRWETVHAPAHRAALEALQARVSQRADDAGRIADVREGLTLLEAIFADHLRCGIPGSLPIGDLFVWSEARGLAAHEVAGVLAGASVATREPMDALRRVHAALEAAGDVHLLDADDLDAILAHPTAGPPLRDYLHEHGHRCLDLAIDVGATLVEMPGTVLGVLAALDRDLPTDDAGLAHADRLAERLDAADRDAFHARVAEARLAARNREASAGMCSWASGLARLGLLDLADRWADRLPTREAIFHVTPDELDALPSRGELERRLAEHAAAGAVRPPPAFGTPGEPPPDAWLPEAARRAVQAVGAYISRFDAAPDRAGGDGLRGLGVSPGRVEGRVFVLRSLEALEDVPPGCILVTRTTTPLLNPVLCHVGGLVTELGGLVCHAAIMARELAFPGVVGCVGALDALEHGVAVVIDGSTGEVRVTDPRAVPFAPRGRRNPAPSVEPVVPAHPGVAVPLADALDPAAFGGKAAPLAVALRAGHRVPEGIALDLAFTEAVAAGDPDHLQRLGDLLADLDGPLAVRSSAPAEDGGHASFAGQHDTILGARTPGAVAAAIAEVWRSARSPGALAYRKRLGVVGPPAMAVVLQRMVPAELSGVRFGRDPVTGEDLRVVEAAPGLGVSVVDGRVTPHRIRLAPDGTELAREAGVVPVQVELAEDGVREVPATADLTLDGPVLDGLFALGEAMDALFGGPQDVEWAVADGQVWLLQSRPVTR